MASYGMAWLTCVSQRKDAWLGPYERLLLLLPKRGVPYRTQDICTAYVHAEEILSEITWKRVEDQRRQN